MRNDFCGKGVAGLTLLEVMLALSVIAIGIMGAFSAILTTRALDRTGKEYMVAGYAMHRQIEIAREDILKRAALGQDADYTYIYNTYGNAANPVAFDVPGLPRVISNQPVGEMFVIEDEDSPWLDPDLGDAIDSRIDMDLDGDFSSNTHNKSYSIFPIRVTITWQSNKGIIQKTLMTIVAPEKYK